jgi:hypothetical protein
LVARGHPPQAGKAGRLQSESDMSSWSLGPPHERHHELMHRIGATCTMHLFTGVLFL